MVGRVPQAMGIHVSGVVPVMPFFRFFGVILLIMIYRGFLCIFDHGSGFFIVLGVVNQVGFRIIRPYGGTFF